MRGLALFAFVLALGLVLASAAVADEFSNGNGPVPFAPDGSAPPMPPPSPVISEPMPLPSAPSTGVYERQTLSTPSWTAPGTCETPCPTPCAPASGCALNRDSGGWSVTPGGCRYGCLSLWVEGLYSFFQAPEGGLGLPPYVAGPPVTPDPIEWNGLDYEGAFGGRVTFRAHTGPQSFIEVRGTYYGKYDSSTRDAGQFGFLTGPGGVGGVIAPNATTLESEAEIYGAELNYWSEVACVDRSSWSLGAGVHWVQLNEDASARNWATPFAPFTTPAFMTSSVENTFIGLQLGGMVRWELSPCFDFTVTAKGMMGYLNRDVVVSDNSVFSGGAHTSTSQDDEIVAGFDVDLGFHWRLSRVIGLTAGYNLLFVDNIQRAHDAMDFTMSNSGAIQAQQNTDQAIVHSVLFGLYFNF